MAPLTLPGADIRGYYDHLEIHLSAQARICRLSALLR
jgi:hypothetical protein